MLIEEGRVRILTDPGNLSTTQNNAENIDVVLITHEHQDHLHIESLKEVLKNNPNARIYTNKSVARLLDAEKIKIPIAPRGGVLYSWDSQENSQNFLGPENQRFSWV